MERVQRTSTAANSNRLSLCNLAVADSRIYSDGTLSLGQTTLDKPCKGS